MSSPCTALNNRIKEKGITHAQLAQSVGSSEKRVADICSAKVSPTAQEFNSLATVLGVNPPAHATA